MSKFTFWGDLFKFSDDVLTEDYHFDKNYSLKVKAKSNDGTADYQVKFDQSKPDNQGNSENTIELKQKLKLWDYTSESKLKSGGKVINETEIELEKYHDSFKGWTYVINSTLVNGGTLDKGTFSSAFKFKQEGVEAKVTFPHHKKGDFEAEVAAKLSSDKDCHAILGGSLAFSVRETRLEKYEIGFLDRLNSKFSYGIKNWSEDGKTCGNLSVHTLHAATDKTSIATNVKYSYADKTISATAGFLHRFNDQWNWKAKIDTQGRFATSSKYRIADNTHVTISSALDVGSKSITHSSPHPFGIGLESTF